MKNKILEVMTIVNLLLIIAVIITVAFQQYQISKITRSESKSTEQILSEIMPKGTPDYGAEAGVSYDKVEESLRILADYHQSISLNSDEEKRYTDIATSPKTACEFCCGIGSKGFGTGDGKIICGCSHNIAFSGLTKWLIKNTDYSNEKIIDEIKKWKILFFPKNALEEEMRTRGISGTTALPGMVGGC